MVMSMVDYIIITDCSPAANIVVLYIIIIMYNSTICKKRFRDNKMN